MKKAILVALVALAASSASAALFLYEGFDYGAPNADPLADDLALNHRDGGFGWHDVNTDWELQQRAIPQQDMGYGSGLSYADLEGVGGAAYSSRPTPGPGGWGWNATANTWDAVERTYWANSAIYQQYDGFSIWVSALMRIDSLASTSNSNGTMNASSEFELGAYSNRGTTFGFDGASNPVRLLGAGNSASTAVNVATGQTYLFVLQLAYRESTMDRYLWVNPAPSTLGGPDLDPATANASILGLDKATLSGKIYVHVRTLGAVDEIRVGTDYASVTPVIPEPASILLLASGMVGAYKLRRRM